MTKNEEGIMRASNTAQLPSNYQLDGKMDLKKDTKVNLAIQVLFVVIAALMIGLAMLLGFPTKNNWGTGVTILVTVAMCVVYMIVHELIHGIFLKWFSGVKPDYFLRFPFFCTGSGAYFNKHSFIIVALAPVVIWGVVLIPMLVLLPADFFLSIYIVTALNFAGAAGDYVQVFAISKLSPACLIQDNGKETNMFMPMSV